MEHTPGDVQGQHLLQIFVVGLELADDEVGLPIRIVQEEVEIGAVPFLQEEVYFDDHLRSVEEFAIDMVDEYGRDGDLVAVPVSDHHDVSVVLGLLVITEDDALKAHILSIDRLAHERAVPPFGHDPALLLLGHMRTDIAQLCVPEGAGH